jgi:hypothetical protein
MGQMRRAFLPMVGAAAAVALTAGCEEDGGGAVPTTFTVKIENTSGGDLPTPFAPGVWALHRGASPLFYPGAPDGGLGLEALAEDGDPAALHASLTTALKGVFDTPFGGGGPAPIAPGQYYEFQFDAFPADGNLSFATMLVHSNDLFVAPGTAGIPLFDAEGVPLPARVVTGGLYLWDAGTEQNQAPRLGPDQAPRQAGADIGAAEGVVRVFSDATRTVPLALDVAKVDVSESGGTFTIDLSNTSAAGGTLPTPLAPVFYAVHDGTFSLFTDGQPDPGDGLESLAEDGDPATLVASYSGATGVLVASSQGTVPAAPGESFIFSVTPDAAHPYLTIASMIVESNDVFLSFPAAGLRLLDATGLPRAAADVEADARKLFGLWDAGTEANEVPGVGVNQAPRQAGPNTGPAEGGNVRLYDDSANDLAGSMAGGFVAVTVTNTTGTTFQVDITNTSDTTVYPGLLTPVAYGLGDGTAAAFTTGAAASAGLEALAEDGATSGFETELTALGFTSVATEGTGPIAAGGTHTFTVTADATNRFLFFAAMVVPSNDTFISPQPTGIALLDASGTVVTPDLSTIAAWDAGTEANQAGAAGADQAPRQSGAGAGFEEGGPTRESTRAPHGRTRPSRTCWR